MFSDNILILLVWLFLQMCSLPLCVCVCVCKKNGIDIDYKEISLSAQWNEVWQSSIATELQSQ